LQYHLKIYAAGYASDISAYKGRIFRTLNAGLGWQDISPPLIGISEYVYSITVSPASGDIILAGTSNTIFKSINGGDSWSNLNTPFYEIM